MSQEAGPQWVVLYPTEKTTAGLVQPFRRNVQAFITELERRGCSVSIKATRRPEQRAWLMHYSWRIDRDGWDPEDVPARADIPIVWSRLGARAMVNAYGLVVRPALDSRHIQGRAIDMTITGWTGTAEALYALGASHGVKKLRSDPPHWSDDGR